MNKTYIRDYLKHLEEILWKVDLDELYEIIDKIEYAIENDHKIYTMGNGGSASIASHFAVDLVHSLNANARSLSDNIGLITAIGNDDGFENIFSKQVEIISMSDNDDTLLIAFSCSGESSNIIKALEMAYDSGIDIIFISGVRSELDSIDSHLIIPSYNPYIVESIFSTLCHSIISYIRKVNEKPI